MLMAYTNTCQINKTKTTKCFRSSNLDSGLEDIQAEMHHPCKNKCGAKLFESLFHTSSQPWASKKKSFFFNLHLFFHRIKAKKKKERKKEKVQEMKKEKENKVKKYESNTEGPTDIALTEASSYYS